MFLHFVSFIIGLVFSLSTKLLDLPLIFIDLRKDKALTVWNGQLKNVDDAQSVFLQQTRRCSEASQGKLNVEEFEKSTRSTTVPYDEE